MADLTPTSLKFFLALAEDAANWSGTPLLDGNVASDKQLRGNLTDLKKKGLVTTTTEEGDTWVHFTDAGEALAAEHGISTH